MSAFDHSFVNPRPRGPYGTNEGDIWSGEDSEVGKMLMAEGLVMIHEMMNRDGVVQERIYNVELSNPDMEMQMLIKKAREGTILWVNAQAANN